MSGMNLILEGESEPFETINTLVWQPRVNEFMVVNDTTYKVEKVEYHVTLQDGMPLASNPRWVSSEYCDITLSVVP